MRHPDVKLETELKRGIFQIAVLSLLREPLYGYQIGRRLSDHGLSVEEGTLYPLLRRMEEQGLLESWWVTEKARPRKYYRTTEDGAETLIVLREVWEKVNGALRRILEAVPGPADPGTDPPSAAPGGNTGGEDGE